MPDFHLPVQLRVLACALPLGLVVPVAGLGAAAFTPPTPEESRLALGSLSAEPVAIQRLLEPDVDFEPIEAPQPGDWLATFEEAGQSFYDFVSTDARRATPDRRIIYLQPLGEFHADSSPSLEALRDYAAAFFQLDVVLLPAEVTESAAFEPRLNGSSGKPQHATPAILGWLHQRLPEDAFCLVAVTMTDLYPAPNWNFVYGQASPQQRTAVWSFARDDPMFFGEDRPDDFDQLLLERSCRTLVHEIAHLFGLHHCIHFRCIENGVNHQAESDSRPHHLCPVCLRKLQHATGADLERRYRDLAYFYSNHSGWEDELAWVRRQLAKLRAPEPARPSFLPAKEATVEPPAAPLAPSVPPPEGSDDGRTPAWPPPTPPGTGGSSAPGPTDRPKAPSPADPETDAPAETPAPRLTPPVDSSSQLVAHTARSRS